MNCKNCTKEFTSLRKTGQFCSPNCRLEYFRKNTKLVSVSKQGKVSVSNSVSEVSIPEITDTTNRWGKNVKEMDAETLYTFIRAYPSDTWKDSPEFKELMKRLKSKPLKTLKAEGYWIPNRLEPYRV